MNEYRGRRRPFKAKQPSETIATIRTLLADAGLEPRYGQVFNPYPQIYSCRLELDDELGRFGTNGKGRTEEYAVASCYAELMERLQNGMYPMLSRTMLSRLHERHDFYYNPGERYLCEAELRRLPAEIRDDLMFGAGGGGEGDEFISVYVRRLRTNGLRGAVSLPFYDTMNRRIVQLPRDLLLWVAGSNGMAAGNTLWEALFQALCELNERWGAAEVFFRRLTPPSVPEDFLQMFPQEHGIITGIRDDTGYEVVVKDFSGGLGIPVLGVVVIDPVGGRYRLGVGSDTSFPDALSRCLTEMYQGRSNSSSFTAQMIDLPGHDLWFFQEETDAARRARWAEFFSFTTDGTGRFSSSLVASGADYPFDPSIFDSRESHEAEVRRLLASFHASGHNVYLHENSFLGFPSVFVYIPGLSGLRSKYAEEMQWRRMLSSVPVDEVQSLMLRLDSCTNAELWRVSEVLGQCPPTLPVADLLQLTFSERAPWGKLNVAYLLALIHCRLGQTGEASSAFDDAERVQSACDELRTGSDVFESIGLPVCPNCSGCRIRGDCLTRGNLCLADRLYSLMRQDMPDQRALGKVFE